MDSPYVIQALDLGVSFLSYFVVVQVLNSDKEKVKVCPRMYKLTEFIESTALT